MNGIRTDEERHRDRLQSRNIRKATAGSRDVRGAIYSLILYAREWRRLMRCAAQDGRRGLATERRWAAENLYQAAFSLGTFLPHGAGLFRPAGPFAGPERKVAA